MALQDRWSLVTGVADNGHARTYSRALLNMLNDHEQSHGDVTVYSTLLRLVAMDDWMLVRIVISPILAAFPNTATVHK